jgi:hypothetical protein
MSSSGVGYKWMVLLAFAAFASVGCGFVSSGGKYAVSGTILFDGQPLEAGTISFAPEQPGGHSSSAMFSGGHYSLKAEKGLMPGAYVVKIFAEASESAQVSPEDLMTGRARDSNRPQTPQQKIPPEYNTKSTQVITVTAEGPNQFDFDIKSR